MKTTITKEVKHTSTPASVYLSISELVFSLSVIRIGYNNPRNATTFMTIIGAYVSDL